jgi:hypothetical protein
MFRLIAVVAVAVLVAPAVHASDKLARPAARGTSIRGNAWAADSTPIKDAKLRLRNAATGKIEATATADDAGRFTFTNVEGGSYVVEIVNDAGKILAVGHSFTIAPGETIGTFVRLGSRAPWFTGFFSNTAAAAASSASSQGITALAPVARAASSRQ